MPDIVRTTDRKTAGEINTVDPFDVIVDYRKINISDWENFVCSHANGNFFQTPAFCRFISRIPNYDAVGISVQDKQGRITGILAGMIQKEKGFLKSILSARLIVIGGPLVTEPDNGATGLLLDALTRNFSGKSIYVEFRNLFSLREYVEVFTRRGFSFADHLNYILDTTSREQTVKNIRSTRNRFIRKSLRNNAKILTEVSAEQVEKFYSILKKLYASKVGKPLPPPEFFEEFRKDPSLGKYFLIEYENDIVAGIMCPVFAEKCIYAWYIAGEDGLHEGIYPSTLATWAPIDFALENGIGSFDFMGAGKPGEDYGVREFKATFGGELVNNGRYTRINNRLLYQMGKLGIKLLKML